MFASFENVLGKSIYRQLYPDWTSIEARAVHRVCRDGGLSVWSPTRADKTVGFVAIGFGDEADGEPGVAEIEMLAAHPRHQRQGIGDELVAVAVDRCARQALARGGRDGR